MPETTEQIKLVVSFVPPEARERVTAYLEALCENVYANGRCDGVRECGEKMLAAQNYLSKFTTPGSVTDNHSIANRTLEILTGDVREYR